ncbi:MAG: energy transducer TonB [Flavobacteriaceae bacterium]
MLFVTYNLLNFKTYDKVDEIAEILEMNQEIEEDIPLLNVDVPPPPPPPPTAAPEVIVIVEDIDEVEETVIESTETSQDDAIEQRELFVEDLVVEEIEEDIEVPFAVIENVPVFPGCKGKTNAELKNCFQDNVTKHIVEHFKYPEQAIELGLSGKVYVMFTVNSKGYISNIKTRGPDKILEKEASRIIGLLPKMEPGKQRGKAVNVPYSVPINFQYVDN